MKNIDMMPSHSPIDTGESEAHEQHDETLISVITPLRNRHSIRLSQQATETLSHQY